jgi:hypothetical protein
MQESKKRTSSTQAVQCDSMQVAWSHTAKQSYKTALQWDGTNIQQHSGVLDDPGHIM